MKRQLVAAAFASCLAISAYAEAAEVRTRIVDTGAGLATVTRFPNDGIMVFDTGHWDHDDIVSPEFQEFIDESDIDLLIASHSDSDHIAATDELFNEFRIHRVIRTGFERETNTWKQHNDAIVAAVESGLTHDINLANVTLHHGTTFEFGSAVVTYLAGFHKPPSAWGLSGSEFRNGNSIVVRVEFAGNSILFTGDAVGRREGSSQTADAMATERFLIDNAPVRPIASDVLIVPHHGSDDASSTEFIRAVAPRWVVFSAGHDHQHPKQVTAERFLDLGYRPECLLRTDLGDNEEGEEWRFGASSAPDKAGDDGIEIVLRDDGAVEVSYDGGNPIACDPADTPESVVVAAAEVKKSRSGICHTIASRWYERTRHFESFDDLQSCLASGGRSL